VSVAAWIVLVVAAAIGLAIVRALADL